MEDWEDFKLWCTIIVCVGIAIWLITGVMTSPPPEPDYGTSQVELRNDRGEANVKLDWSSGH